MERDEKSKGAIYRDRWLDTVKEKRGIDRD